MVTPAAQMLYREVNEKLAALNEAFDSLGLGVQWVCECADANCAEPLKMTLEQYADVRERPDQFAVLPGHTVPSAGRVVEEHETYVVVQAASHERRTSGRAA